MRALRERHEQRERERGVLQMREAVVSALAPAYVRRVGSSAIYEAVDEALAQIVAAGSHLREPEQVKGLWITCARRRLIDEQRSAASRHRCEAADGSLDELTDPIDGDLMQPTEDGRQRWRIREILSVLRGDQRRWAEAWYDEVLSASRLAGGQPRGLPEALGWTPSKTKSVSRRARGKMASFIAERASGAVCDEQRALLDEFIMAGQRRGEGLDEERYQAVVFHLAGCDDCWAEWHARRRALLGRCSAIFAIPVDALAVAGQEIAGKVAGLAIGAHGQAYALLARVGVGGAAVAGGGAATISAKATAVCVGVVCAATAGGELAGVLPPIASSPAPQVRRDAVEGTTPEKAASGFRKAKREVVPPAAAAGTPTTTAPAVAPPAKPAIRLRRPVRKVLRPSSPPTFEARGSPGALPPASSTASAPRPPSRPSPAAPAFKQSTCLPGDLGC